MDTIYFIVQQMWFFSIPLMVVALGGMFSERSGVINIALEGIMVFGAFCSIFFINKMQGIMSGQLLLVLAILVAAGSGMLFSLLHAYAAINLRADQTISGTALNMGAPAIAIFAARMLQENGVQQVIPVIPEYVHQDSTGAGDAFLAGFLYGLYHDRSAAVLRSQTANVLNISGLSIYKSGCKGSEFHMEYVLSRGRKRRNRSSVERILQSDYG